MIRNILFDLDGTLLNIEETAFERAYFQALKDFLQQADLDKGELIYQGALQSVKAMRENPGKQTNEDLFWQSIERFSQVSRDHAKALFDEYYRVCYAHIGDDYIVDETMIDIVHTLLEKGYLLVVATNPLLPEIASRYRLQWCGLNHMAWLEISSFEHYSSAKPDVRFYQQICERKNLLPQECLMIGNRLSDDFPATYLGMEFYLLLNDFSGEAEQHYDGQKGSRQDLLKWVKELPIFYQK